MSADIRYCTKQGTWYSSQDELKEDLVQFFNNAKKNSKNSDVIKKFIEENKAKNEEELTIKYLICPHAGLVYCGHVTACGFSLFKNYPEFKTSVKRIIMLGVCHSFRLAECSQTQYDFWCDPLDNSKKLPIKHIENIPKLSKAYDSREHSLEIIVPFVSDVFGEEIRSNNIELTMIYCDSALKDESKKILQKLTSDKGTLVVVSSDFCHSGRNYDYYPQIKNSGKSFNETVSLIDMAAVETIMDKDANKFVKFIQETDATICGRHTIEHMLRLCSNEISESYLLQYDKSGPLNSFKDSAVSYVSMVGFQKSKILN